MCIHSILTGRFTGIPVFAAVMILVFFLTFNVFGKILSDMMSSFIDSAVALIGDFLISTGAAPPLRALVIDGICTGVGSVLEFVPVIAVLFFFLSLLEETGYLPNIAAALDKPMMKIGLSGRCIVPLIMGFGCNVPAILAAGSIFPEEQRMRTIFMIPFMSCSAKLPIYALLTSVFFEKHKALAMAGIYFTGILTAITYALISGGISRLCRSASSRPHQCRNNPTFPYKLPSLKIIAGAAAYNAAGYIKKAFTVILAASVAIWLLQSFDCNFHMASDESESILAYCGKAAAPFFTPLGFGEWQAVSAVIAGISAKEAVVSTLAVLSHTSGDGSVFSLLSHIFSPLSAFSFMIFCLLYIPCIATLAAVKKQTGSWRCCLTMVFLQISTAWLISFSLYSTGNLFLSVVFC